MTVIEYATKVGTSTQAVLSKINNGRLKARRVPLGWNMRGGKPAFRYEILDQPPTQKGRKR